MPGHGYDFYDMETLGMEILKDGAEVEIHVRDRENLESKAVRALVAKSPDKLTNAERLHIYGRLGVSAPDEWYIEIVEELGEEALGTEAELAERLDPEMAMKAAEQFKKGRPAKKEERG